MTAAVGIAGVIAGLLLGLLFLRPAFALRAEPNGALVLDVAPRHDPASHSCYVRNGWLVIGARR